MSRTILPTRSGRVSSLRGCDEETRRHSNIKRNFFLGDRDKSDKLIQILVQTLMKQLRNTPLTVAPYRVGLDDRVVEVLKKLLDLNDVRILGLYGMGGVGWFATYSSFGEIRGLHEHDSHDIPKIHLNNGGCDQRKVER
ncbi:hypothetical protein VNO80_04862 [Phaseolus coccineus]|uniref:Uncharacterized protein n=1 Tax=Phaseolus coccineus TaxID=3886 RepID=A0AAN9P1J7_PHACN